MKIILNETLRKKEKSQYWLAKETGIAASTINNLCNNKTTRIDFDVIDKICATLNCSTSDVLLPDYLDRMESYKKKLFSSTVKKDDSK